MSENSSLDAAQLADSAIPADADPIALFEEWFAEARASEPNDSNAMALATATPEARLLCVWFS